MVKYWYFNDTIENSINDSRFHHQLLPMYIEYEKGFNEDILNELAAKGHELEESPSDFGFAALTAIARRNNKLIVVSDRRREGVGDVF